MPKIPLITALLAAFLFGAATPASKALMADIPPFQLAGLLYIGAALGIIPLIFKEQSFLNPCRLDKKNLFRLIGSIIFGGILGPVFLLFGLRFASSVSISMWLNLELVATALLGYFIFRDHLTPYGWLSTAGMLIAAALLTNAEGISGITAGILVAIACFCWGLDNHLTVLINGMPPSQITFWKGIMAGIINFSIGAFMSSMEMTFTLFGIAIIVGVFSYGISVVLYIMSSQKLGTTRGQIIFSTAPFFGVVLSTTLLGESVADTQIWAGLIIMSSLVFLFLEKHEHEHIHCAITHDHWHKHDDGHHAHILPDVPHGLWHSHLHEHEEISHSHKHLPDLDHRHKHNK
ncbi:MAG: DMT family transporter [Candidatus Brocadiaceae bacterium]|nr:DMT family transporter [Candidatus Brocadiaceae bacterium]